MVGMPGQERRKLSSTECDGLHGRDVLSSVLSTVFTGHRL